MKFFVATTVLSLVPGLYACVSAPAEGVSSKPANAASKQDGCVRQAPALGSRLGELVCPDPAD